jgi:hypothetical protein
LYSIPVPTGVSGTSDFCNKVLLGTADLSHLPAPLQAIFLQLHQPHLVEVNIIISFDNYKDALQKWKESTSTSPSSCHLGHYITLLKRIGDKTDEVGETILQLHHTMLQIAQYCCKPYKWWKTEMEVMLKKDKGDPRINQLCIICLYEADYNIFLIIMWAHQLVRACKDNKLFDNTQTGGDQTEHLGM